MTTFEAVKLVQEMLGTKPDSVRYAGIKDVNAVTAQRISIRGARPEAFAQVNHPRFFLKDLTAGKGAIATGDLQGNRFSILVRTPTASQVGQLENEWQSRFTHVAEQGFYNFFYLQRFSSPRYINHEWGRDIIGGHYEKAVRSILCDESPTELPFFGEMRRWFRDHYGSWTDIREFIDETFPEALYVERALAAHLEAYPGDFVGALRTNEKQVMMWVYAYSSKLFNESISSYILSGREVPATLPLVVSHDREDIALYRRMLERDGLFPPNWMHLRPFPSIRTAHREVHTKSRVQLHRVEFVPEGVRCSFTLEKGEYATTFLAHLFNLVGGIDRETDTEFSRTEASSIDLRTRAYFDSVLTKVGEPEDT
jgi:tRNA(Glu) U13 pseudouridine synthase TruD